MVKASYCHVTCDMMCSCLSSQVGTHADSLVAEAVVKGFKNFDLDVAYEAVHKDATVPPEGDDYLR